MTSERPFPRRLTKVDELMRCDHAHLSNEDECYFLGEYTARRGYAYSSTNNLISNFKKPMDRLGLPEWPYKQNAIEQAGNALAEAIGEDELGRMTFVPIPPSKAKGDPLYDDRLMQMLKAIPASRKLDIREIVVQKMSTDPVHQSESRPTPEQIEAIYEIDRKLLIPEPPLIAIVDDILTTGAHFRASKSMLSSYFPATKVIGLFVARRVPDTADLDDTDRLEV